MVRTLRHFSRVIATVVLLGSSSVVVAAPIDSFNNPGGQTVIASGSGATSSGTATDSATILGGTRDVTVTNIQGAPFTFFNVPSPAPATGAGAFTLTPVAMGATATLRLRYDGGALLNTPGLLNANFSANPAIVLNFINADALGGSLGVTLTIEDGSPPNPSASQNIPTALFTNSSIMFDLTSPAFSSLNLANIQAIQFDFTAVSNSGTAITFTLGGPNGGIELVDPPAIPEPSTYATFGFLALMGGYVARRKLKTEAVATA